MVDRNTVDKNRIINIKQFIEHVNKLDNTEKQIYLANLEPQEIKYVEEILNNFLQENIKIGYEKISLLGKLKNVIYDLISNSKSDRYKKKILSSIKGLYIITILFPAAIRTLGDLIA